MFAVLFSKEIREHLMTFRFGAALITTFILIVVSAWVLGDDFNKRQTAYNRLAAHYKSELERVEVVSRVFPTLHRPPTVLSIFSQGENPNLGNIVQVRRWSVPRNATGSLSDNQFLAAYPTFDLLSIFTLVISLFGILFTYDSFSGERVNGTLKVICSYKVSRSSIFFSKFAAGVVVLAIPFVISLLSALLVLQFLHNITFSFMEWSALLAIVFGGILYGAIFVGMGMLSSAMFRNSSSSLVLSLLIWSLGVFLIPLAATNLSTAIQPLASEVEIDKFAEESDQAIEEKIDEMGNNFPWRKYGGASYGECALGGEGMYYGDASIGGYHYAREKSLLQEKEYSKRADDIWAIVEKHNVLKRKQREVSELLSFPAPAFHLRKAITALSGTHYEGYSRFMKAVRKYRTQMLANMRARGYFSNNNVKLLTQMSKKDLVAAGKYEERLKIRVAKGKEDPEYEYDFFTNPVDLSFLPPAPEDLEASDFETSIMPVAVMMIMLIILLVSSYFVFMRYDVR